MKFLLLLVLVYVASASSEPLSLKKKIPGCKKIPGTIFSKRYNCYDTSCKLPTYWKKKNCDTKVKLECVKEGNSVMGGYECCSGLAGVTKKRWNFEFTVCPKPPTCKRQNRECAENMDCCEDLVCHKMNRNALTGKTTGRCSGNPCDKDNFGCSDICDYDGYFPTCSCSSDTQQLSSDHHTCTDCVGKNRSLKSSERVNFAVRHMPRIKDVCCPGLVEKRVKVYNSWENGYGVIYCRDPTGWKKEWDYIEENVKAPAHAEKESALAGLLNELLNRLDA